jgi:drug/metabolite transporter (DMT)-like permease
VKIHRHFVAIIGAWILGSSLGGWHGALAMAVVAACLLHYLEKREKR